MTKIQNLKDAEERFKFEVDGEDGIGFGILNLEFRNCLGFRA